MVSTMFNSSALGLLLIFLALRESLAYTHQGMEKVVADGSPFNFEKETFYAIPAAAEAKSRRRGGRKMMEKRVLTKETANEEGVNEGGASKISGNDRNLSKKPLATTEEHMHDQDGTSMMKPKSSISGRLETSAKMTFDFSNSKADSSRGTLEWSKHLVPDQESQKLESQKLTAETATDQMVNLMNKDYQGAGKAHHKPPINN